MWHLIFIHYQNTFNMNFITVGRISLNLDKILSMSQEGEQLKVRIDGGYEQSMSCTDAERKQLFSALNDRQKKFDLEKSNSKRNNNASVSPRGNDLVETDLVDTVTAAPVENKTLTADKE